MPSTTQLTPMAETMVVNGKAFTKQAWWELSQTLPSPVSAVCFELGWANAMQKKRTAWILLNAD